ncbi:MAG: alpha/beta fold hydrolase [Phormidesmis sp. RL_2_1]|nr:alpha/beta fold hydrolase [Phormidesmis sp. RL_2_1]
MPLLTLKHHTLYYVTDGQLQNPPLLLLHGFLGSHQDFVPLLPALAQHFYCIIPDLPGHGQSIATVGHYGFPETAKALLSLLDFFNLSQTHVLGYSMGGRLALYLACEDSRRCQRVILESASPGLKTAEERLARIKRDQAIARQLETTPLPIF